MSISQAMRMSAAGMAAERTRLDITSGNLANAHSSTVRNPDGSIRQEAFRRQLVSLLSTEDGPKIVRISRDLGPLREEHDPSNPNADPQTGLVQFSNVEPITEMVNMMSASRAYEANIQAFNSARGMLRAALRIGQV